jgi:hypothetical protein
MMSARSKKILNVLISVITAAFTGWLVRAAYGHEPFQLPAALLVISVSCQVALALIASEEEKELATLRSEVATLRQEKEIWHKVEISKLAKKLAIADQQIAEIRKGNMAGVREWAEVEKNL